jgi:hypothetical protein
MVFVPASISILLDVEGIAMLTRLTYQVGNHTLEVTAGHDRWVPAVDGVLIDRWFTSLADAWTAGVTEAMELDRGAACSFVAGADAAEQH